MGEGGPLSAAHSRATQKSSVGRAHVWVLHIRTPGQVGAGSRSQESRGTCLLEHLSSCDRTVMGVQQGIPLTQEAFSADSEAERSFRQEGPRGGSCRYLRGRAGGGLCLCRE